MSSLLWPLRSLANGLGLAWWARIQTRSPEVTYWFGPFVRRTELEAALPAFLADVESEGPGFIEHELLQVRRGEPLTVEGSP
ncbi:DUF1816 domain-containing protein [Cyanobium sp. ATX 6F1]|uniref:DUF1816 domain-containing protein n=1 Tax=unclassified Cyanobium TaxID=2627006 RepID=UPI0020CC1FC7|nr:DUF1816 domain-containing protein [Cyanobium sp. ATX 6F1]MCP9916193.1 DUF1816 domain-containing protein [Cyanobium sp. ATX 6F1]